MYGPVFIAIILILSMFYLFVNMNQNGPRNGGDNEKKGGRLSLEKDLPLFLDIPGAGTSSIPLVLSKCLGLNYVPIKNIEEESYKKASEKIDFLTTNYSNNACEILNFNARPFFLMQNPLLRVVASYKGRRDVSSDMFDKSVANIKFDDYLRTYAQDQNLITKSILCKQSSRLSLNDLEAAKKILKNKYTVGIFNNYLDSIKLFQKKHNWKSKLSNHYNCIEKHSERLTRSYHKMLNEDTKLHFHDIFVSNFYDIKLYLEVLNETVWS